uniref:NADH-ubiquinone oxidoreductase chain 3 n=1 Tax=Urostyla grandis TaxID=57509 RepID=A0A2I4PEM3_9SPIT|nr:Nad3 [Urostyla grandis]
MGDFEVAVYFLSASLLGAIIYNIINIFFFRNLIRRFGIFKASRKDFYECGFRPQFQRPIRIPVQYLLICAFFLVYDMELVFLFPVTAGLNYFAVWDFILLIFFASLFLLSLVFDYERHALSWQY